jgi:hypothetical protein
MRKPSDSETEAPGVTYFDMVGSQDHTPISPWLGTRSAFAPGIAYAGYKPQEITPSESLFFPGTLDKRSSYVNSSHWL